MKGKKQFGVWMDTEKAVVIGRENIDEGNFSVIGSAEKVIRGGNSNENATNNAEKADLEKYFKEILAHMQNVDELHVTGPGKVQENFINYLKDTPQYKNVETSHCTSTKSSNEKLVEFFDEHFSK